LETSLIFLCRLGGRTDLFLEIILQPQFGSFVFGHGIHIGFPAGTEVDVPSPDAAEEGFGVLVIPCPERAGRAFGVSHESLLSILPDNILQICTREIKP
jgi:hypothetical protein